MTRRERLCPAPTYRTMALVVAALVAAVPGPAEGQHTEDGGLSDGEEVRFRSGELELAGLWFTPAGQGPFPAAVIIRGSGESRRDNPWARLFVDVLLENDVAVLMPDKRGSGASGGDWRTATFTDLAEDAVAAVGHVSSRPEVDPERVGLVGLSQGGRVAPVAAAQSSEVAFVVNVVGSAVPFVEQIDHEMEHTFREVGLTGDDLGAAMALHEVAKRYVSGEIPWDTYRSALDSALASEWRRAAEGFPATEDHWRWEFFRGVMDFDPLPWWRRVEAPALVLYGGEDSNTPTVRSVERLREAFSSRGPATREIRVFEELGHGLLAQTEGRHHRLELHPDVVRALTDWLRRVLER
ncbi:MAG: alpha/beta hydrolase family protein [Gemmatimonadota bacterium]